MQTTVNNNNMIITYPTLEVLNVIQEELTYKDKSKQYQLRRMGRSAWGRNSPLYHKLKSEVEGKLYSFENPVLTVPSSFYDSYKEILSKGTVNDLRKETGAKVVLPWVNKPFDLRDYQREAVDLMLSNYRGIINFATGLGKTLIAVHFIKEYKKKALVICPSESVAKQFYDQFVDALGKNKVGYYGGGKKKIGDVTVAIAASVTRNIEDFRLANFGVVIFDEVHHTPATTFYDIAVGLASVGKVFGLTATDYRSDGKDVMITAGCGKVLARHDIKWGVQHGWLAEPYFIVREVKTGGRDFKDDKLKSYKEHVLNNKAMCDRIESDARSMMASGKSVLILVDEVAHGDKLSAALGIPLATGLDKQSQSYVELLNKGKIPGLVGTDSKIGEGTDTRNVDCLILANFVASRGPVTQAIGRALRKQGAKTKALILDYIPVDSTMLARHGNGRIEYYLEITDKVKVITV